MKTVNLGVLAHVDAGKTTLTEQLLYQSNTTHTVGSVDAGTAQTDSMKLEQARGISIQAAAASIQYEGVRLNFIDTPGHTDFAAEVERSLLALDGAILVISAVEGIQSQTELLYDALRKTGTSVVFFINKLDRAGSRAAEVIRQIRETFTPRLLLCSEFGGEGERSCWVRARDWGDPQFAVEAAELLAEEDDVLLERYLSGEELPSAQLEEALIKQIKEGKAAPVLLGCAVQGTGVRELLHFLSRYMEPVKNREDDACSAVIYKIAHDRTMGRIAYLRMFGGSLENRQTVLLPCGEQKITQIRTFHGTRLVDAGRVEKGNIAAVCGWPGARVADVIGEPPSSMGAELSAPLFQVHAQPEDPKELFSLKQAFQELSAEDPKLDLQVNPDNGELDLQIAGVVQLEVLRALVKERYRLDVTFSPPQVIYKETPAHEGHGYDAYTMPKPCWAIVGLDIKPLPRGSGFRFSSVVPNDQIFYRYQTHIETACRRALKQGLWNWEVVDLSVTLTEGSHHTVHTHPLDFFLCTPIAFLKGLQDCGVTLLEPVQTMRILVPEEFAGKIVGDLLAMRGESDSPVIHDGIFSIEANVPVASSMDYGIRLASFTSGKGVLSTRFSGYRECPPELAKPAVRRGVNPLDRDRWILANRSAMQEGF